MADERGVPAYLVFSDKVLWDMILGAAGLPKPALKAVFRTGRPAQGTLNLGDAAALEAFTRAERLDPTAADNSLNIGAVLLLAGQREAASDRFRRYLEANSENADANNAVRDTIALNAQALAAGVALGGQLLSVASASASPSDAARRRADFAPAAAEDMEGFAVALAAQLAGPAAIVAWVIVVSPMTLPP